MRPPSCGTQTTGEPIHNAIVWQDTRTDKLVQELGGDGRPGSLPRHGPDCRWRPISRRRRSAGSSTTSTAPARRPSPATWCSATWTPGCLWNLTGGVDGGLHITDVTNASRTMLMDLKTLAWDESIAGRDRRADVDAAGDPRLERGLRRGQERQVGRVALAGDLGDQQAATFGQACFDVGEAKNTYGTGNFMLLNTGTEVVQSKSGSAVDGRLQDRRPGRRSMRSRVRSRSPGALVQWLRDNLKMIKAAPEVEELAMSRRGQRRHVHRAGVQRPVRAVLEVGRARRVRRPDAVRQRTGTSPGRRSRRRPIRRREVVDAMATDSGVTLDSLKVDGGMVANDLLMQFQADILGVPVIRPQVAETTALGAAYAAGLATGFWHHPGGPARELGRGQALGPQDGSREARPLLQGVEEGGHPDVRLGRLSGGGVRGAATGQPAPGSRRRVRGRLRSMTNSEHRGPGHRRRRDWRRRRLGRGVARIRRRARRPRRPRRGDQRPLPWAAALGRPLRGQGPARRRGVHRREPDPAPRRGRLHRGHRRPVRDDAVRRPGLRRHVRRGLRGDRRRLRGDRRRRGAALRAPSEPGDLTRVPRARRQHRRLEDGLGDEPRRPATRRQDPHLPRGDRRPPVLATESRARACAARARARRSTSRRRSPSTPPAPGPARSPTWPGSRASACCRAAGS